MSESSGTARKGVKKNWTMAKGGGNGCEALAQSLREKGPDHYHTDVIGALVGLLQYGIILMCIRTFFWLALKICGVCF